MDRVLRARTPQREHHYIIRLDVHARGAPAFRGAARLAIALRYRLFAVIRSGDRRRLHMSFIVVRDRKAAISQRDENAPKVSLAQRLIIRRSRFKTIFGFVSE